MKIRLASPLQPDSIVDGEGIRTVIWTQGCKHHCTGCHNAGTWNFEDGFEVTTDEVKKELSLLKGQQGITLSGGDPLFQAKACTEIAKYAKEIGLDVWCYTGFTFERLLQHKDALELLKYVDVLVDGPFILKERSLNIDFRGSRNQRIIDVKASLEAQKPILIEKYQGERIVENKIYRPQNVFI